MCKNTWTILERAIFLLIIRGNVLHIPIGQSAIVSVINDYSLTYRFSIEYHSNDIVRIKKKKYRMFIFYAMILKAN